MFTILELLDDNMSRAQIVYALLADCIFFGSMFWAYRRAKKARQDEGDQKD